MNQMKVPILNFLTYKYNFKWFDLILKRTKYNKVIILNISKQSSLHITLSDFWKQ